MNIFFDPDKHEYTIDGVKALGVTSIINNIPEDLMFNSAFIRKGEIGTAVHEFAHLLKTGSKPDVLLRRAAKHQLPILPYFEGYIKFYREAGFKVILSETQVGSKKWYFGGIVDDLAISPNNRLAVMDIKTSTIVSPTTALQTAGYGIAVDEMIRKKVNPIYKAFKDYGKVKERWCIWLTGDDNYKLIQYKSPNDTNVFLCAVTFRNWKVKNGLD